MRVPRLVLAVALGLLVLVAIFAVLSRTPLLRADPKPHRVTLAGIGERDGFLVPLPDGRYLLHSEDLSLILDREAIEAIDGESWPHRPIPVDGEEPFVQETLERISPEGEVEVRSAMLHRNRGSRSWTQLSWGLAPHEVAQLPTYRMYDNFGNELAVETLQERPGRGMKVGVQLLRPLVPGESGRYVLAYRGEPVQAVDGVRVYRNRGDYPDNRLVTRSVLLPAGAEIVSVDPQPLHQLQVGEQTMVIWRRYFRRGEVVPWEIRFRHPE